MRGLMRVTCLTWLFKPLRLLSWCVLLCLLETKSFGVNLERIRKAIFKVQVVSQNPRANQPWLHRPARSSSGSGFYIGDGLIMTNAHVVARGKFITVLRDGIDRAIRAEVKYIAHDCDLALIKPIDSSVLEGLTPLVMGSMPRLQSPVATIGYPKGGEQISITKGVVSRIGYRRYVHSGYQQHLLVQVDSAINSGNSGGPVLQGRQVVGVAFQSNITAENTGYIIPPPVVQRFLIDVKDGKYDGHPQDGIFTMKGATSNPSTAKFHQLLKPAGVKVSFVAPWSSAYQIIQPRDILLKMDGFPIGVDGKVNFLGERVSFHVLSDLRQKGETIPITLQRGQTKIETKMTAGPSAKHYQPANTYGIRPRYLVFAGMIFSTLNRDFLKSWGKRWYRDSPATLRYLNKYSWWDTTYQTASDIIIFSARLPDRINNWSDRYRSLPLESLNQIKIKSLAQLDKLLESSSEKYFVFKFFNQPEPLIIPSAEARSNHKKILEKYQVKPEKWLHH